VNPGAAPAVLGGLHILEKTCNYCGAHLCVLASHAAGNHERHLFSCPECGKQYRIEAIAPPQVQLLRPRNDGKQDKYQETMF
jgi:hypothetical protein